MQRHAMVCTGMHDIGLLSMLDHFYESGTKTLRSVSIYTKPGAELYRTVGAKRIRFMWAV